MGHSHSSSHKRLRSISSIRNCGEFTEVVDLEFSDAGTFAGPAIMHKLPQDIKSASSSDSNNTNTLQANIRLNSVAEENNDKSPSVLIQYPKDLLSLEDHVKEVEQSIEGMSPDEFFVYFPSLKDDLHNCWQKVYGVKEQDLETKLKKHKVIDNIRELLRKLNARLQRREFGQ